MKRVAVLGASGYVGRELCELVERHTGLELAGRYSARLGVTPGPPVLPFDPVIEALDLDALADVDLAFLCTPHGASAELAQAALDRGVKVVDLSADSRLRDPALYARVYGVPHPAPELLAEAVYGLTEHARDSVAGARLVANPGCYPTTVLLALLPLLHRGLLLEGAAIVADCKSGLSGAGKRPGDGTHFGAVHDNFKAYGVGTHRHQPEIAQEAGIDDIVFVPHLLPVFRGILATLYVEPAPGVGAGELLAALSDSYRGERFARVYERGLPELDRVQRTNQWHVGVAPCGSRAVLVACLDNLVKGAAGQAVQNANLMLGLEEAAGLS